MSLASTRLEILENKDWCWIFCHKLLQSEHLPLNVCVTLCVTNCDQMWPNVTNWALFSFWRLACGSSGSRIPWSKSQEFHGNPPSNYIREQFFSSFLMNYVGFTANLPSINPHIGNSRSYNISRNGSPVNFYMWNKNFVNFLENLWVKTRLICMKWNCVSSRNSGDENHVVMNEKVQALAGSIYEEFEKMLQRWVLE